MQHGRLTFPIILLLLTVTSLSIAQNEVEKVRPRLLKPAESDSYRAFLINNIFNYYSNNGDGSFNRYSTSNEGFEFLKGSAKHLIFEDGIIWGGFQKDSLYPKVGGSMYRHGLQAGPILISSWRGTDPVAANPADPTYRIYRVRPDVNARTPHASAIHAIQTEEVPFISRYENLSAAEIFAQYLADWDEWPAMLGAPFSYGVDELGKQRCDPDRYDPRYDTPGQPGADQTLWYVANDFTPALTNNFIGSPPLGLEMQRTIWGYNRPGALQYSIFSSTRIINKSGFRIDSMFIGQWSDPDVGNAGDDLVGCDTTLALGYAYNGRVTDSEFGAAVPAVGFAILQGPILPSPGDTAVFAMKRRAGYRNLSMTAFTAGYPSYSPIPVYLDALQIYRNLNGYAGNSGASFIDPVTNQPTKFVFPGNPVPPSSGWVDGTGSMVPQDRRMLAASGPFTLAPGDTQEIVVVSLAGSGTDHLSSVNVLKAMTRRIQSFAKSPFALPAPPPAPLVNVVQLDREIVLTWGDAATIEQTESFDKGGFKFEGYNVYEFSNADPVTSTLLATFDRINGVKTIVDTVYDPSTGYFQPTPVQRGTDNGVTRSMRITSSAVSNSALANGSTYQFAVTAFSFSPDPPSIAGTHALESLPVIYMATPHGPNPGTRYGQSIGDLIPVTLTTSPGVRRSDGGVFAMVIDPTRLTGDTYDVRFRTDTSSGAILWDLLNTTRNRIAIHGFANLSGGDDYPIIDGVHVKVVNPPPGMKRGDQYSDPGDSSRWGWRVIAGQPAFTPAGADPGGRLHLEGFTHGGAFPGAIGNGYDHWSSGGVPYSKLANVLIKFAHADGSWDPTIAQTDSNFSRGYRFVRHADTGPAGAWVPNRSAGYAYQDYNLSVPFSAWNLDANPPVRLAVGHLENNDSPGRLDGKYWPPLSDEPGVDNATIREWFFIFDAPYSETTPLPGLAVDLLSVPTPLMWWGVPCRSKSTFESGEEFEIIANHMNIPGNTFTYTTVAPTTGDPVVARIDVTRINAFPNPCFGFDPADPTRLNRAVTFTHLPTRATIRIFTLAGVMVRSLLKDDASQFAPWDLKNENGRPVGSGMYVVYIEMPELGVTRTLKLGVIAALQ